MGLKEMNERLQKKREESPARSWGNELRLRDGDLAFVQFVGTGDDGDEWITAYRAHAVDRISQSGQRFTNYVYCPQDSGNMDLECPLCLHGYDTYKDRMVMWFWVRQILHTQRKQDENYPQVDYQGQTYYQEEIDDFRLWENSAWAQSPWDTIMFLYNNYKNKLHGFGAVLMRTGGGGLDTKYSLHSIPETEGISQERYEEAKGRLERIPAWLAKQVGSGTQARPVVPEPSKEAASDAPWKPEPAAAGIKPLGKLF